MVQQAKTREVRCAAAKFAADEGEDLVVKWVSRFPLARVVNNARIATREFLGGDESSGDDLPLGRPNRANRDRWYPALLHCVQGWQSLGMTPMDSYREVAERKGVDVNLVKQWIHVAKKEFVSS
jgi:hypothetical protein